VRLAAFRLGALVQGKSQVPGMFESNIQLDRFSAHWSVARVTSTAAVNPYMSYTKSSRRLEQEGVCQRSSERVRIP